MGEAYELASELAMIAEAEGRSIVLICRRDGTFQMTYADPAEKEEDHNAEGTDIAVNRYHTH